MPIPHSLLIDDVRELLFEYFEYIFSHVFLSIGKSSTSASSSPLPILVFVHGDSYMWGSGNLWDGRVLAAFGRVVVVTFNYRLGALGKNLINE